MKKVQYTVLVNGFSKLGKEGIVFSLINSISDKPTSNITLNGERLKASHRIRKKAGMNGPLHPAIQHCICTEGSSPNNRETEKQQADEKVRNETVCLPR